MGVEGKGITLWDSGAPQVGDLRLFEDGSKRGGTLVSNAVAAETAKQGDGERASVATGVDRKANAWGQRRTPVRSQSSP